MFNVETQAVVEEFSLQVKELDRLTDSVIKKPNNKAAGRRLRKQTLLVEKLGKIVRSSLIAHSKQI